MPDAEARAAAAEARAATAEANVVALQRRIRDLEERRGGAPTSARVCTFARICTVAGCLLALLVVLAAHPFAAFDNPPADKLDVVLGAPLGSALQPALPVMLGKPTPRRNLSGSHFWPHYEDDDIARRPTWTSAKWMKADAAGYPIEAGGFPRSFRPGSAAALATFAAVAASADAGLPIVITVIGGSMTVGTGCGFAACAWAGDVAAWLHSERPHWRVTVRNVARGSTDSEMWARSHQRFFGIGPTDVFLVDTSVNSAGHCNGESPSPRCSEKTRDGMDALLWRLLRTPGNVVAAPGILVIGAFRLCVGAPQDCRVHCGARMQTLVHSGERTSWCPWWRRATDFEFEAARFYGLPTASYRDAAWPLEHAPPLDLPRLWGGLSHPDRTTHELFGDVVKFALAQLLFESAVPPGTQPLAPPLLRLSRGSATIVAACNFRSSNSSAVFDSFGAHNVSGFQPLARSSEWALSAGKPAGAGWAAASRTRAGAQISFPVRFSEAPRLEITFIQSHNKSYASASAALDGCMLPMTLRGTPKHMTFTLPHTAVFTSDGVASGGDVEGNSDFGECAHVLSHFKGSPPGTALTLTLSLITPGQFKVLGITSC